jgi:hypothetical protein
VVVFAARLVVACARAWVLALPGRMSATALSTMGDGPTLLDLDALPASFSTSPSALTDPSSRLSGLARSRPGIGAQRGFLDALRVRPLVAGELWYVVDAGWYRAWQQGVCDADASPDAEFELPPLNTARIAASEYEAGVVLKTNVAEGTDYELVHKELWDLLVAWCVHDALFSSSYLSLLVAASWVLAFAVRLSA